MNTSLPFEVESSRQGFEGSSSWKSTCARVRIVSNFAWWLEYFLPSFVTSSLIFALANIALRRSGVEAQDLALAYLTLTGMSALGALLIARQHFLGDEDSLILLDTALHLNGRLIAARQGVASWPAAQKFEPRVFSWRENKIVLPLALGLIVAGASFLVPITKPERGVMNPNGQPLVWQEIEEKIEQIRESQLANADELEKIEQKLEALKEKSPEQWFEHSTLEASEAVKTDLESSLQKLSDDLAGANTALKTLSQTGKNGEEINAALQSLESILKEQESTGLPMNQDLANALKEGIEKGLSRNLSKKEAEALRQKLEEASKKANGLSGDKKSGSKNKQEGSDQDDKTQHGDSSKESGDCSGGSGAPMCKESGSKPGAAGSEQGQGDSGQGQQESASGSGQGDSQQPGNAGISRGRGDAPLNFSENQVPKLGLNTAGVRGNGAPQGDPNELVELKPRAPEPDKAPMNNSTTALTAQSANQSATWDQVASPKEKEYLEKVFK